MNISVYSKYVNASYQFCQYTRQFYFQDEIQTRLCSYWTVDGTDALRLLSYHLRFLVIHGKDGFQILYIEQERIRMGGYSKSM